MGETSSRAGRLPPGPKPLPLLGNLLDFIRQGPDVFENAARTYGDITTVSFGARKHFIINDPALIQTILVKDRRNFEKGRALRLASRVLGSGLLTSDGEVYQKQRRAAQPAFNIKNMDDFGNSVLHYVTELNRTWRDGLEFDVSDEMSALCLNVAAQAFLGVDLAASAHTIVKVFDDAMAGLNQLNLLPPFAEKLPLPLNFRLKRLKARLGEIVDGIIAQRRASEGRATDLLSLVLANVEEGAFTPEELREQVITFLFAGYEAPCRVLTWTWYLLARHPEAEAKLHDEIAAVLGERAPAFEDWKSLPYTRGVVSESMRLYPPAWIIARRIMSPYEVGGWTLPAGEEIFLSPYITQRDARFFPNPLAFDPGRWLEPAEGRPQFAYFPFGGGLRGCAGVHFAWPEMVLLVAGIAQRWRVVISDNREVKPNPAFTFAPSSPIRAVARSRGAVSWN